MIKTGAMPGDERIESVLAVMASESFAVFAFAGEAGEPPYSSVMFFAETPDLEVIFGTSPGAMKGRYLEPDNGCVVQVDTRGVGLENVSQFARITLQGRLELLDGEPREAALATYAAKLPHAKVFLARPGVQIWRVRPLYLVFSRGFGERFELDLPARS